MSLDFEERKARIRATRQAAETPAGGMSEPETILDAALWVARELGGYVFALDHPSLPKCAGLHTRDKPCDGKRGKHPCVKFSLHQTNTEREIIATFAGATRNYGVATRRSRLLVIDEDEATLADYARTIGETVPETFAVSTGRGQHLWFSVPAGLKLSNSRGRLPKGIDVRAGSEGYVVGPGSLHANGVTYRATWDRRPTPAPQWLVDAVTPEPVDDVDADSGESGESREVPERVTSMLAESVGPDVDRSERFYAIVAECKRAGLSRGVTTLALIPWCERVGKYKGRVAEQVTACWKKLPAPGEQPAEDKAESKSAATLLVELATERYAFCTSDGGEPFAVPRQGPMVVQMLRGGKTSLRSQLARTYFTRYGRVAAQQALADALAVVDGIAQDNPEQRLALRVAGHDGDLWLDMGDPTGRAIRITGTGWTVADRPPVLFKRTALNGSLPEPQPDGDLGELWRWLNVTAEDRPLVAAYLVAALQPDIPHPVLDLSGEQGSGKTTAQKVLVKVLDPGPVPNRKPPRDADSWVTAAAGSWIVGLDNLSDMPDWLSDSICRAVTGDGDVRRRLYTDGDLAVFAFRRCIVLTGIDLGAVNGDLAERMLSIRLDAIPEGERLEEGELWPGWQEAHPRILGAVLDLAASVARVSPSVRLDTKPRMADFARVLACVDHILGTEGLKRYLGKQSAMASESLTGVSFIVALADGLPVTFYGTARQLLDRVTPDADKWRAPKDWPANARVVTQLLRRHGPTMRKAGWLVEEDGGRNKTNAVRWIITPPEMARDSDSPDSPDSPDGETAGQGPSGKASKTGYQASLGEEGESGEERTRLSDEPGESDPGGVSAGHRGSASKASKASHEYGPSLEGCPDCGAPYESLAHQIDCEGLDS